jgi:hypothetical protein
LPPPIITDIDGDGYNEIIMVTREPRLVIVERHPRVNINGVSGGGGDGGGAGVDSGVGMGEYDDADDIEVVATADLRGT